MKTRLAVFCVQFFPNLLVKLTGRYSSSPLVAPEAGACAFRCITPAWNNFNLASLVQIRARAHIPITSIRLLKSYHLNSRAALFAVFRVCLACIVRPSNYSVSTCAVTLRLCLCVCWLFPFHIHPPEGSTRGEPPHLCPRTRGAWRLRQEKGN